MKGFTLIEVMVVALIVGFLGLGIVNVIANSNSISSDSTRKAMLSSNVQRLMMDIGRDVKGGAKLESDGSSLSILNADKTITKWTIQNEKIMRLSANGNSNDFLLIGAEAFEINNINDAFKTSITGAYHKVEIDLSISMIDPSGTLTIPNITNAFYCRTNPDGIIW